MTIRLPPRKANYVKEACRSLLSKESNTVRELAHVIGLLISSLPGVQYGDIHYRKLELNKTAELRDNKGTMTLS